MIEFVTIFVVVLILLWFFFYAFGFPLWMFIHCAISKDLKTKPKVIWILTIFFLWTIGGALYGLFASSRKSHKWISGIFLFFSLSFIGLGLAFMPKLASLNNLLASGVTSQLESVNMDNLSAAEQAQLKSNLDLLKKDLRANWMKIEKMQISSDLFELLDQMTKDNYLSRDEYDDWTTKFETRGLIDTDALKKHIRELKRATPAGASSNSPTGKNLVEATQQLASLTKQLTDLNKDMERLNKSLPKYDDNDHLCFAAAENNIDKAKALLAKGINPNAKGQLNMSPLENAVLKGHTEMVKLLLAHGADPNTKGLLENTLLIFADQKGHIETTGTLLKAGADVNQKNKFGQTPLEVANQKNNTQLVKLLKDAGARE